MKIVIVSSEVSKSKSLFSSVVASMAEEHGIGVVLVNADDAESFNGLTADMAIVDELILEPICWSEPISTAKKGSNKPYYRHKERW